MKPTPKIQDHAIIGDGRSAALISRDGSIDWLCWPRFDSPSIFAALLDASAGGHWSIRPLQPARTERRYLDDTNVLETSFETSSGSLVATDFMLAASEEEKGSMLLPECELIRRVTCLDGKCDLKIHFAPRDDYGGRKLIFRDAGL